MTGSITDPQAAYLAGQHLADLAARAEAAEARADSLEAAVDQARADLDSKNAHIAALHDRLTQAQRAAEADQVAAARAAARPATGTGTYRSVADWVEGWLLGRIERDIGTRLRWCPRWHEHPEAVWRLTAMWNDWERGWSRPDGGPTMWARNSPHPHLDQLTVGHGPFSACSPQRHEPARTLPATDWA